MALTAKKVYAILKRQISDMEAKLNSPVRYRGTVATADLLPLNPDIGDMYNIESKSVYGEAGMNVAWNGVVWDTMGAPIDMSLYLTKEEAEAVIQRLVTEYFEKNPVKPGATTEQAQQIEQNKTDIASLKVETGSLKADLENSIGVKKIITPEWINGKRIAEDGSIINSGTAFYITDFIDVVKTDSQIAYGVNSYSTLSVPSIHYYDNSKNHIGYAYGIGTYDMANDLKSNNAKYIRLSQYSTSKYPLENVKINFISEGHIDELEENININTNKIDEVSKKVITNKSKQFVNILEGYNNCENGKMLSNGNLISHANWTSLIDYVPVKANTTYGIKFALQFDVWVNIRINYYKEDKTFISEEQKTNNNGYTTPQECAYIRMSTINLNYSEQGHDDFSTAYMEEVENGMNVVVENNKEYYVNAYPITTLMGKKWALFGDSITENNIRSNANYHDYVRSETGIVTVNNGVGGSGYKNRDDNNNSFYQIALKTIDTWKNADVITVMGGVNDHWGQIDNNGLGSAIDKFVEPTDITLATKNTVMACFNKMIDMLIANAPNSRIGVISPLPCYHNNGTKLYEEVPYDEDCNMSKFVNECKKACVLKGIPYLDLFHNSGLRPWDNEFNAKYFKCISSDSPDGLHPNELGHKFFYPMVREFLKTLI